MTTVSPINTTQLKNTLINELIPCYKRFITCAMAFNNVVRNDLSHDKIGCLKSFGDGLTQLQYRLGQAQHAINELLQPVNIRLVKLRLKNINNFIENGEYMNILQFPFRCFVFPTELSWRTPENEYENILDKLSTLLDAKYKSGSDFFADTFIDFYLTSLRVEDI